MFEEPPGNTDRNTNFIKQGGLKIWPRTALRKQSSLPTIYILKGQKSICFYINALRAVRSSPAHLFSQHILQRLQPYSSPRGTLTCLCTAPAKDLPCSISLLVSWGAGARSYVTLVRALLYLFTYTTKACGILGWFEVLVKSLLLCKQTFHVFSAL